MKSAMQKIFAPLFFFVIAVFAQSALAHELGVFGKKRPAVSHYADEKVKEFRRVGRDSNNQETTEKLRKSCPKEYVIVDRIFERIRSTTPVDDILKDYPVAVWIWCDSKDDRSGGTLFRMDGVLQISGSYLGRARSEDALAFAFAHELSHFLYAHDEELSERILSKDYDVDRMAQEAMADESALELISRAGYDPSAAQDLIRLLRIDNGECLRTPLGAVCLGSQPDLMHGSTVQRKARIRKEISLHSYVRHQRTADSTFKEAQDEWRRLVKALR